MSRQLPNDIKYLTYAGAPAYLSARLPRNPSHPGDPDQRSALQPLVGPDTEPLVHEEALEKEQGRIGGIPLVLLPHWISRDDDLLHPIP